jgi:hypothetical protein
MSGRATRRRKRFLDELMQVATVVGAPLLQRGGGGTGTLDLAGLELWRGLGVIQILGLAQPRQRQRRTLANARTRRVTRSRRSRRRRRRDRRARGRSRIDRASAQNSIVQSEQCGVVRIQCEPARRSIVRVGVDQQERNAQVALNQQRLNICAFEFSWLIKRNCQMVKCERWSSYAIRGQEVTRRRVWHQFRVNRQIRQCYKNKKKKKEKLVSYC